MINQNELRIGNFIAYRQGKAAAPTFHTILAIADKVVRLSKSDTMDYWSDQEYPDVEGIELNLDLLEKMGFNEGVLTIGLGTIRGYFSAANGGTTVCLRDMNANTQSRYLTKVHEVQNLYYALTGNELPIK